MDTINLLKRLPLSQIGASVLIDLGDKYIFVSKSGEVSDEKSDSAAVTLKLSEEDLCAVLEGKENVISLFTLGKIEVEGDMDVAFKLKSILG